jgi:hypothetical protein
MEPVLALQDTRLPVEAGEVAQTTLRIRNAGAIVEQYHIDVLGPAAAWTEVAPAEVSVYPGNDVEVLIIFHPPRDSSTPSGDVPFGIRCASLDNPADQAVVEGDLAVGAIHEFAATIKPEMKKGRWRARYTLRLDNRGTAPTRLQLSASDPADALAFVLSPRVVEVPPRGSVDAKLTIKTRKPIVKGDPIPHRFQVEYAKLLKSAGDSNAAGKIDGSFTQRAILTRNAKWLAVALAGVAALSVFLLSRGGDEKPAPAAKVARPALAIEPGPSLVTLSWTPDPLVATYSIEKLADGGDPAAPAPDIADVAEVNKGLNQYEWPDLAGGAAHCFRLVAAVEGNERGIRSDFACAETPANAKLAAPIGLIAVPQDGTDGTRVDVSWEAPENAPPETTYSVLLDNAEKQAVAAGAPLATTIDIDKPGKYCISVLAKIGEAVTPPSNDTCLELGAGADDGAPEAPPVTQSGDEPPTETTAPLADPVPNDTRVRVRGYVRLIGFLPEFGPLSVEQQRRFQETRAWLERNVEPRLDRQSRQGHGHRIASAADLLAEPPAAGQWLFEDGYLDPTNLKEGCTDWQRAFTEARAEAEAAGTWDPNLVAGVQLGICLYVDPEGALRNQNDEPVVVGTTTTGVVTTPPTGV